MARTPSGPLLALGLLTLAAGLGAMAAGWQLPADSGRGLTALALAAGVAAPDAVAFDTSGNACHCRAATMSHDPAPARHVDHVRSAPGAIGRHGVGWDDARADPRFYLAETAESLRGRPGEAERMKLRANFRPAAAAWAAKFMAAQTGG